MLINWHQLCTRSNILSSDIFHIDLDNVTTLEAIIIIYIYVHIYIKEWRRTLQLPSNKHHRCKQLAFLKDFFSYSVLGHTERKKNLSWTILYFRKSFELLYFLLWFKLRTWRFLVYLQLSCYV